jgi:cell division protein FtsQ
VQSLTADGIAGTIGAAERPPRRPFAHVVLPRPLRRPARILQKATWRLPPFLGLKSLALLFTLTTLGGVVMGGHAIDVVAAATAWSGLAIDDVRITGQSETAELDVLQKLQIGVFPSLFTFDLDAAKGRVETLPWVADATLRKVYPNELSIVIHERTPYAVWQDDAGKLWLIDNQGHQITDAVDAGDAGLPMVVGEGAAARVGEFTALIAGQPRIAPAVRAGVLVGGRRWTVVLDGGIELMLPQQNPAAALATIAKLDADSALLSRDIAAVDLRAPDHTVVRLDAAGVAARTALLKARAKLAKAKSG